MGLGDGGPKAKFRDNVAAIKLLQALRAQGREASPAECQQLVRYVGWGGLPQAFDHRNEEWRAEYKELAALLTGDAYEQARRSTQDAHYTSETVIRGIYDGLQRLGFTGGKVLEPASGTGHFIGLMPPSMRDASAVTAVELDPTTSAIGRLLYPNASHVNRGYQDVVIPSEHFDLVVGNPPFGNQSLYDPFHRDLSSMSIHNFFLAKSVDKLRPGGLMAVVVSRYFMDSRDRSAREHLASHAELLAAIRLPNMAFKRNALTEVTTDILFFRKRSQPADEAMPDWTRVGEMVDADTGAPFTVNRYFCDHPEQMAGTMVLTHKMHRDNADLVAHEGEDLASALAHRLEALPQGVFRERQAAPAAGTRDKPVLELPASLKVGAFFVTPGGRLARRLPDLVAEHDYVYVDGKGARTCERIRGMVDIRDQLRGLMNAEQSVEATDTQLASLRSRLNATYDAFVERHGHISSQGNRLAMGEDPEFPLIHALESEFDKGVSVETARRQGVEPRAPTARKADIFSQRVIAPQRQIESVATAKDALVVSMNELGRVDLDRMVRLTGKDEDALRSELDGLIYHDPASQRWVTTDQYLTGNVKRRLEAAQGAAAKDPRYDANVVALMGVQPADIDPVDISVQLGSTWVPERDMRAFVKHLLGDVSCSMSYQESVGKWLVKIGRPDRTLATVTWGTESYPANELVEAILSNRSIQVKREEGEDDHGRPIYRVDDALTTAANQKADEIRQAFLDWIWEDKDRRTALARLYNDRFNTNVPARFDGSHLRLPGSSLGVELRPSQKDAIWRGIQEGNVLYDHVVGAGKTYVLVGVLMESRRMGLLQKPMLVVPNHLLLQWKDAFYALYPQANVLVAEKTDFQKENRERLFGRIATGSWDAVIIGHSSFKKIGMPPDTLKSILEEQIEDITQAITALKGEKGDRLTIKEMEKTKDRMRERMERKADTGEKDRAVSFADLGVDAVAIDEAHEFKNLFISTSLTRVSGLGNLAGSEKAFDLFVKCRYLQERNGGRGVFFATGTPISNTIAELYTMQRYMQYDDLKARGIVHFDAWASTFGQVVTGWELDATGVNYRLNSRFAKFQNVPELISLYRSFADVVAKADLDRQAAERGTRFPVPKLRGGRPENIVVERSQDQAHYMGVLATVHDERGSPVMRADGSVSKEWSEGSIIWRMENLPDDPSEDNPLKITNDARKAGLDFRLIDPSAADFAGSKVNVAVDRIYEILHEWQERRGTQIVFCDLSTPKGKAAVAVEPQPEAPAEQEEDAADVQAVSMDELLAGRSSFSVYDDIRGKLIARGVPAAEVRFMHEAKTDLQKARLFQEMNRGDIRILLASTAKAGAGTNVQRRLVAEHHLDVPWRPSDLEQREGRILRQGNLFYEQDPDGFEVQILRYATKQSYDSRMWQTIEYKAAGIEQFRRGDMLVRVIDDVAGEAANAAEMKAAATGNPLIFQQVKLSAELKKVEALFSNHRRALHALEARIGWLEGASARAEVAGARWQRELDRRGGTGPGGSFRTLTREYAVDERDALQADVLSTMSLAISRRGPVATEATKTSVGWYREFEVDVVARREQLQFSLKGDLVHEPDNLIYLASDKFSAQGFISRLDNYLARFESFKAAALDLGVREQAELRRAHDELKKPFGQHDWLEALRADVRDVMAELKLMQGDDAYVSTWRPKSDGASAQIAPATATSHAPRPRA